MGSAKHIREVTFESESLLGSVKRSWQTVQLKGALGHFGLLVALMIYTAGGGLVRVLVEVMGCAFRLVSGFGWSLVMMLVGLLAEIKVWFRLCIFGLFSFDSSKRNKNIFS